MSERNFRRHWGHNLYVCENYRRHRFFQTRRRVFRIHRHESDRCSCVTFETPRRPLLLDTIATMISTAAVIAVSDFTRFSQGPNLQSEVILVTSAVAVLAAIETMGGFSKRSIF